jgi:hypothetical protein
MLPCPAVLTQRALDLGSVGGPKPVAQQIHDLEDRQRLFGRPVRGQLQAPRHLGSG